MWITGALRACPEVTGVEVEDGEISMESFRIIDWLRSCGVDSACVISGPPERGAEDKEEEATITDEGGVVGSGEAVPEAKEVSSVELR